jgi:membrane associated rhomboid family serine protease
MFPLYDTLRARRFPLVNWVLIAVNAAVFLYELKLGSAGLNNFINTWGLVPTRLFANPASTWTTIYSAMFMHAGWFHILSNMWILFIFGDNIEDRLGKFGYLIFYLLSGTAAALLDAWLMKTSSQPMIGASGAIAGVLGAYLVLYPRARIASLVPIFFIFTVIQIPAYLFLLIWFGSQLFSGFLALEGADASGIAWWAHIGGFVFGMFAVLFFGKKRNY